MRLIRNNANTSGRIKPPDGLGSCCPGNAAANDEVFNFFHGHLCSLAEPGAITGKAAANWQIRAPIFQSPHPAGANCGKEEKSEDVDNMLIHN